MAEALVSVIIEQLVQVLKESTAHELRLVTGVEKEVKMLQSNFEAIRCVLEDAEEKQIEQRSVKHWLARLKKVAYDMDDVLDEWNTAILKLKIDGVESDHARKKVCSFLSCFAYCRQVVRRHDIATKIKEINEEVDVIAQEKDRYGLAASEIKQFKQLESTSFVDVSKLLGRDEVKDKIVSTLLGGNDDVQTISIVGMGGLGKTALAQLIFNDGKVQAHFDKPIWVCVSNFFDQKKIAREILEGLDQNLVSNLQNPISLQIVLAKICDKIKSAKFLLVLDDVWTEREEDWESLKAVFQQGMSGSMILVTTRKESVATVMGSSNSRVFPLEALSDEACWLILSQLAFVAKDNDLHENLEDIGREIAKKCNGLPLAAKTLGGLLRGKKTRNEWQYILNSEIWKLNDAKEYIFSPLLLSYYDLPSQIRPCLLYCAVIPKDFRFLKSELIKQWMANGYLNSYKKLEIEEEKGEEYFNYLASRSFFQDFGKDEHGNIIFFKMHDMVHHFVQYLAVEEVVTVEVDSGENDRLDLPSKKAHHLRVTVAEKNQFPLSILGIEKLRSLLASSKQCFITSEALQALFKAAKCLRLLDFALSRYHPVKIKEIPNEIGKLVHLRYLDLSYNVDLKELPEAVCELHNLQHFNLKNCTSLEKLPDGIWRLINLRSLSNLGCDHVNYYPKGIGGLTSLRDLTQVTTRIDGNDTKELSFGDLENLDLLRGSICIKLVGNVVDGEEAKRAKLHNKIHLKELNIQGGLKDFDNFIQALNPLPGLRINTGCA